MRVIGYVRVSTREQADSRLGLDAQRRALSEEAGRRSWSLTLLEDAGHTGKNTERPGLQEALRLLRRGEADALLVSKLDRVSRSVHDFARLLDIAQKQRWAVVALDMQVDMTTPNGRLVANILVSVAQWEAEVIGARTKDAMAEAKAGGQTFGRPRQVSDDAVARVVALRESGLGWSALARAMQTDGVPSPAGGMKWWPATARRVWLLAQAPSAAPYPEAHRAR